MADFLGLSPEEAEELRRFVADVRKRLFGTVRTDSDVPNQATEVYIARVPSGGIPGLGEGNTGTASDDAPGSATCNVYQINSSGDLDIVGGLSKTVYNIGTRKVAGNSWTLIFKDKFGNWIATSQNAGIRFWFTANGSKTRQGASVAVTPLYMITGANPGVVTAYDPGIGYTISSGMIGIASLCEDGTYRIEIVECSTNVDVGTGT